MGIITKIKRWWESLWAKEAQDKFGVETIESDLIKAALNDWVNIYQGKPPWVDPNDNDIESFNFAKKLCNETARLTTLALGITVEGSARADWINSFMESYISRMKNEECEKACAFGYIILKPNGKGIDYVMPWDFCPTHQTDGKVDGGIFFDHHHEPGDKWYYTRLEWQRFEDVGDVRIYRITNKTYKATGAEGIGQECSMGETVWANLQEDAAYQNIEQPLFSIFKMPLANNIDMTSPLGVSIFANAQKELKSLDIAWTRLEDEIFDSQKITFLGDMLIDEPGRPVRSRFAPGGAVDKQGKALPRHVRILPGSSEGDEYHEVNPAMQTADRLSGIDHFLNLVGVKCGYSTGQFVLNGRTGQMTATQVEADDRETIQLITQIRASLQTATDGLIYALDKWADIYHLAPVGVYEVAYDFDDITANKEEDKLFELQLANQGYMSKARYLVRHLGMTEKEAAQMVAEAQAEQPKEGGLFGEE
ncbi:MAG: hypothetical protein NC094_11950 [Bacteroidales bacterium]|nr:hypothetical protein [Lachnoclostridium sp.]MCM1385292.1 hypothetical protein [Lachnoclostridium sp.]MCM1466122.1 hypothetical protein [Bacteroidales bacterium]